MNPIEGHFSPDTNQNGTYVEKMTDLEIANGHSPNGKENNNVSFNVKKSPNKSATSSPNKTMTKQEAIEENIRKLSAAIITGTDLSKPFKKRTATMTLERSATMTLERSATTTLDIDETNGTFSRAQTLMRQNSYNVLKECNIEINGNQTTSKSPTKTFSPSKNGDINANNDEEKGDMKKETNQMEGENDLNNSYAVEKPSLFLNVLSSPPCHNKDISSPDSNEATVINNFPTIINFESPTTKEMEELKKQNEELRKRIAELEKEIESVQTSQNESLQIENKNLQQKNMELSSLCMKFELETMSSLDRYKKARQYALEMNSSYETLNQAYNNLYQKFEKTKETINAYKENEATYKEWVQQLKTCNEQMEAKYDKLKEHSMSKFREGNERYEKLREESYIESQKLKAILKKQEIKIMSLEQCLAQATTEKDNLILAYDDLVKKL